MNRKRALTTFAFILLISIFIINEFTLQIFTDDGIIDSNDIIFILWTYDILALIIGLFIIIKKGNLTFSYTVLILISIQVLSVIILLEVGLRIYLSVRQKYEPSEMVFDEIIGWQNTPFMNEENVYDLWGPVIYTTQEYGFRKYGDTTSDKTKVLVIGDSFTMAGNITDGKAYYDYLLQNGNIELFVYGGGGYGTLQQYLILDNYFDEIDPDIIIWQFCDNDLINNHNELEGRSLIHSGIDPRPYYVDGNIVVLPPWRRHGTLYNILNKSYIVKILSLELKLFKKDKFITIEETITKNDRLYIETVQSTKDIMGLVLDRIADIPIISFNARIYSDFPEWWSLTFSQIANDISFVYLHQVSDSLNFARSSGIIIDGSPIDEHWNSTGHAIVGKILKEYLENNNYIN